jgi:hypothetical protein
VYTHRFEPFGCVFLCAAAWGIGWPITVAASDGDTPRYITPAPQSKHLLKTDAETALLNWVKHSGDNAGLPFMVIDKTAATARVYDKHAGILGAGPVLIGLAIGDDSVVGIGSKRLEDILPGERTTPAGRFPSSLGQNLMGVEILWIDYDSAVSMHPLVTTNKKENRTQRLASPSPADNRISFGCINVSERFFRHVVTPAFKTNGGMVYILPEIRSMAEIFGFQWTDGLSEDKVPHKTSL